MGSSPKKELRPLLTNDNLPVITYLNPESSFPDCWVYIHGTNITNKRNKEPKVILSYEGETNSVDHVRVYDSQTIGVNIPAAAKGKVEIYVQTKIGISQPLKYEVQIITTPPIITGVTKAHDGHWLYVNGSSFTKDAIVKIDNINVDRVHVYDSQTIGFLQSWTEAHCLTVTTKNGVSNELEIFS